MNQTKAALNTTNQLDKPHPKYRNVIFDLGGVLINFKPEEIIEKTFEHHKEKPWYLMDVIRAKEFAEIDRGVLTPEQALHAIAPRFPYDNFHNNYLTFFKAIVDGLEPLSKGVNILHNVRTKGFKTYILSNLFDTTHNRISAYEFLTLFDGAIFSYQVKLVKPDPEIYKTLLTRYNLQADECIFIDDLEPNIHGAQSVGIDGILCKDHDYVLEELKKRRIIE